MMNRGVNLIVFKSTILQAWNVKNRVEVRDVARNLFFFRFFDRRDMERVMEAGSWNFDRRLIVLKEMKGDENPKTVSTTNCNF